MPTLGLHALTELVDDCSQGEQALVDGGPFLHPHPLRSGLGYPLRAGQVHESESGDPHSPTLRRFRIPAAALHHLRSTGLSLPEVYLKLLNTRIWDGKYITPQERSYQRSHFGSSWKEPSGLELVYSPSAILSALCLGTCVLQ
jgi:hypothetical protein